MTGLDGILEGLSTELRKALGNILDEEAPTASGLNVVRQYLLDNRAEPLHDAFVLDLATKLLTLIKSGDVPATFLNVVRLFLKDAETAPASPSATSTTPLTDSLPFDELDASTSLH